MFNKILIFLLFLLILPSAVFALSPWSDYYGYADTRACFDPDRTGTLHYYIIDRLTLGTALTTTTRNGTSMNIGSWDTTVTAINALGATDGALVIFEVGGEIGTNDSQAGYIITHPFVYIAGQTAPSPGITFIDTDIFVAASDVIVAHIRIRGSLEDNDNPITVGTNASYHTVENVIIDHVSASWAVHEANILVYQNLSTDTVNNISIVNCISSESLYNADPESNSKGMNIMGSTNVSLIGNYLHSNYMRNPYIRTDGETTDGPQIYGANNLTYNADQRPPTYQGAVTGYGTIDWINNVVIGGPMASGTTAYERIFTVYSIDTALDTDHDIFLSGNMCDDAVAGDRGYTQTDADDWDRVDQWIGNVGRNTGSGGYQYTNTHVSTATLTPPSSFTPLVVSAVEANIISNVGARPNDRDAPDIEAIAQLQSDTGIATQRTSEPSYSLEETVWSIESTFPSSPLSVSDSLTNAEDWLNELKTYVENGSATNTDNTAIRQTAFPTDAPTYFSVLRSKGALTALSSHTKTTIAFVEGGASADTITDSNSGFVTAHFEDGDTIQVSGTDSNDGFYLIDTVTAGTLTLETICDLTDESAGDTVTLQEWPTFYLISEEVGLDYDDSLNAITRSGFPMYEGGYVNFWTWDKDNKILMTEVTGTIDGNDDRVLASTDETKGDYISAYFQTAPVNVNGVAGLLLKKSQLDIEGTDVVIQHHRSLVGMTTSDRDNLDLLGTRNICDHCTEGWGMDENANLGGSYVGEQDSGTATSTVSYKLVDSGQNFITTLSDFQNLWQKITYVVHNTTDDTDANVTAVDSNDTLSLDADIMASGETFTISGKEGAGSNNAFTYNMNGESYRAATGNTLNYESKGSILGGTNLFVYKNLWLSNWHRNPLFQGADSTGVAINNFTYNPADFGATIVAIPNGYNSAGPYDLDFVGNIVEGGPNSNTSSEENFISFSSWFSANNDFYFDDNCWVSGVNYTCQDDSADWDDIYNHVYEYLRDDYNWVSSGSGTNEYYMRKTSTPYDIDWAGKPTRVELDWDDTSRREISEGTMGSLSNHEWDWGDNDSLGYNTMYVRLDEMDPDSLASDSDFFASYTLAFMESIAQNLSAVVGYGFTPDTADADLKTDIINNSGAFPAFRGASASYSIEYDWASDAASGGSSGSIPIDSSPLTWPTVTLAARNIETDMVAVGYVAFPSDPWGDDNSNGRYNFLEWIDGLTIYAETGSFDESDITAPVISNPLPSGSETCTTDPRDVTIYVTTDETATCKYDTSDTDYDSMSNTFDNTNDTSHSQTISDLDCGESYIYYVRCSDSVPNKNSSSTEVSFSIASSILESESGLLTSGSLTGGVHN